MPFLRDISLLASLNATSSNSTRCLITFVRQSSTFFSLRSFARNAARAAKSADIDIEVARQWKESEISMPMKMTSFKCDGDYTASGHPSLSGLSGNARGRACFSRSGSRKD